MAEEANQLNAGEIQPDVQAPTSASTTALDELRTRRKEYLKYQNETQAAALEGRASFLADVVTWEDPVALGDGVGLTYRVYAKSHEVSQAVKGLRENGSSDEVTNLGITGSFIYIHGGGWRVGNLDSEDLTCRRLCHTLNLVVFSINYRKVPEHPYPIPITDAKAGVLAVNERYISKLSSLPVIICGSSSGGHIAGLITQAAVEGSLNIRLDRTALRGPVTVHPDHVPTRFKKSYNSYDTNDSRGEYQGMASNMRNGVFGMASIPQGVIETGQAFPLWGEFKGHPRTYIEVSDDDVLLDDGLCYAKALEEAGVEVKVKIRKGDHTWWLKKYDTDEGAIVEEDFVREVGLLISTQLEELSI
ncbi:hypothetical protein AOL_s00079g387 [Orbilia oligospora ATCC 24927]|uniref:Alpha/beta hydrolase fold-3 domain-containing protein n=1 Tax=Arthrobotrys oligospora (strain ATCC 24927 / CBS 115.81 / DSM 1491) TaxID=756982 RepID=G1XDK2_ARTOA|nr:hypothetical protein AOL_s00079g387 [Orbilia oligospora ATCC 24927]EGX48748.1 hypothetical protein AOL_s00079g387 [Orbilia oligospora ATCC 24927]